MTTSQPVAIEVSGPTSGLSLVEYELLSARRALQKLKSLLGRERLIELLRAETDETEGNFNQWLAESGGKFRPALTGLRVTGLSTAEFFSYFDSIRSEEPKMLAAHPEHFVIAEIDGGLEVIENCGPYISHFRVRFDDDSPAVDELLPDYPVRMVGDISMREGSVEARVLHQFKDTDDGFEARLAIYFPAVVPDEVIEGYRQHQAVEFSNWIAAAAAALGRDLA